MHVSPFDDVGCVEIIDPSNEPGGCACCACNRKAQ
jgi:hypothetical protein